MTDVKNEVKEVINTATVGLENLMAEAERIKNESKDFIVQRPVYDDNIRFTKEGTLWFRPDECRRKGKELPLSRYALGQFCSKIDVPGEVYAEMLRPRGFRPRTENDQYMATEKAKRRISFQTDWRSCQSCVKPEICVV